MSSGRIFAICEICGKFWCDVVAHFFFTSHWQHCVGGKILDNIYICLYTTNAFRFLMKPTCFSMGASRIKSFVLYTCYATTKSNYLGQETPHLSCQCTWNLKIYQNSMQRIMKTKKTKLYQMGRKVLMVLLMTYQISSWFLIMVSESLHFSRSSWLTLTWMK